MGSNPTGSTQTTGIPSKGRYTEAADFGHNMMQADICPGCGTRNMPESRFCSKCGEALTRCPECGTLNAHAVMFCTKCGEMLASSETRAPNRTDSIEKPYVVWEGLPFALLMRASQTKRQYFLNMGIAVAVSVTAVLLLMSVMVPAAQREEPGAGMGVLLLSFLLVLAASIGFMSWMVGRRGAEEEEKEHQDR